MLRTRAIVPALLAICVLLASATAALAAPVELTVRIEGATKTLFEGPVATEGHDVRAASDDAHRRCDGTNNGAAAVPGPTPTAAAVDAMSIAGEDFDGTWFAGYEDYYIERWGPDAESFLANDGAGAFWALLLDGVLAPIGGCQLRAAAGEEVLWAWDGLNAARPFLRLRGVAAPADPVVEVGVGEPLVLSVGKRAHGGVLGAAGPLQPAGGVPVRLVATDPVKGFQSPGAALALSGADGRAAVEFDSPGWKRLKAAADGAYIRSNRLDVCVRQPDGGGCGAPPTDTALRSPAAGGGGPGGGRDGGGPGGDRRRPPTRARPADSSPTAIRAALERSVRFLQEAQNRDGGFGASAGGASDPLFSAWAAYALAAAGINPQDQARPGGTDVHAYLTSRTTGLAQTTDFVRVALVALASGTSPDDFGGVDAIAAIRSRQLPDGSFPQVGGGPAGWVNATAWSVFPLSALDRPGTKAAVARAADWLLGRQSADGSWPSHSPGSPPSADTTAAAIQALNAAGRHGTAAQSRAFGYLRGAQRPDGGFEATPGTGSNAATTAWAVQAIWSAGGSPRQWRSASGADPLSYLASLQRPDGSIGYTASSDANSLWMTAQVGPALAGRAYPLAAVPRRVAAPPRARRELATAGRLERDRRRGEGGELSSRGAGAIAGGGGRGAPLFSAPQPQSGGSTPRGARSPEASSPRGSASGTAVEGMLVGARSPAAPGLFGAGRGGEPSPLATIALLAALAAATAFGAVRQHREAL